MNNDLVLGAECLGQGCILRIRDATGRRIECLDGVLWVTQDGDPRDVVIAAGEAHAFDRDGQTLVSALADSRYVLLDPAH